MSADGLKARKYDRCKHNLDAARARVEDLEAERQAVLDVINIYGDDVLHAALDAIGWPWGDGSND